MCIVLSETGLTFDDVELEPRFTNIPSRFDESIDLSTQLLYGVNGVKLLYPIISANMDTVTGKDMAAAMYDLGGLGIIHRFMTSEAHRVAIIDSAVPYKVVCIGVGASGQHRLGEMADIAKAVLIDVAHGHCDAVIDQIKWLKSAYPHLPVIAGNIATRAAAEDLILAGANCLKVGIGPGSLCTTRLQTGCGVPQLTAILNVAKAIYEVNKPITLIADGGIKNSGDIVKALAAGADAVMIGNLFAGTVETPGTVFHDPGSLGPYKIYRGMASQEAQLSWKGSATSVEGELKRVRWNGNVKTVFSSLINGILSGMTYQNARNLHELRVNAVFRPQTQAGYRESTPHAL